MASPGYLHCANCIGTLSFPTLNTQTGRGMEGFTPSENEIVSTPPTDISDCLFNLSGTSLLAKIACYCCRVRIAAARICCVLCFGILFINVDGGLALITSTTSGSVHTYAARFCAALAKRFLCFYWRSAASRSVRVNGPLL